MCDTIPQDVPQKQCNKCLRFLPATTEYFPADAHVKCGLRSQCKECRSIQRKTHRQENIELYHAYEQSRLKKHREQSQKHKNAHRERYRQAGREYYHSHKEQSKIYRQKYDPMHKADKSAREKARYYANREKERSRRQAYRQSHREERAASLRNYRARKRNNGGSHTVEDIRKQYGRQKGKCYWCHKKLGTGKFAYHVDHVVPVTRGGSNDPSNLVIACHSCNESKNNKLPHEWPQGGRLL